jgi:D-inositol-3-phosphate glycosyltransferase
VLGSLLPRLAEAYDVHLLGIGYRGPSRNVGGVTLHPTNLAGGDVFGAFAAAALVEQLGARLVFLLNDVWMLHACVRTLADVPTTLVAYVPLDGRIVDDGLLAQLGRVDRFVAFTRFGGDQLEARTGRSVDVIPHGVDTETFRPLPAGRAQARRHLFGGDPEWRDAFVVLNANRPHERKRIDLTIEGFALFARDKPPGVKLWLHHAIMDGDERAAISALASKFGVGDRLRLTELGSAPLSDEELNLVYNAGDVGLNTAMGEGWGLVSFEHAATGAAQVVPGHSACAELWTGAAELVEADETGVPRFSPLALRTVSAHGVAAALDRLYADPEHLRRMSLAAHRNATRPAFGWDEIAAEWRSLFEETLAARGAA